MVCYARLCSASFTHLHVSYTSQCSYSNNINSSIGMYFDEVDVIHRVTNVETGVHELKTGMHELKNGMYEFKTEIKADTKDWKTEWKTDTKEWKGGMKALEQDMNMLKTGMKESEMERKSFQ